MGCYKPLLRWEDRWQWTKAKDGHLYHPAVITGIDRLLEDFDEPNPFMHYKVNPINCGKCIGCRLDNSRNWANRAYLESLYHENNWFVTITYDDKHVYIPEEMETSEGITYTELEENEWFGALVPKDFKQFVKNLRQIMKRDYNQDGIRYIGCGEYGSEKKRPHYHFIFFNLNLPAETFYNPRVDWEKAIYYQNEIIERAWGGSNKGYPSGEINPNCRGICNITTANWNNMAYVARYITKKQNGKQSEDYYAARGQEKEFFRSSTKPGIGRQYYEDHKEQIYKYDKILIQNKKGSHWVTPPKYFDRLYEAENPEDFERIKEQRRKSMINSLKIKDLTTSLTREEQLLVEMRTKELQASTLKRTL